MGMAASQARLLSITSRMADNELRSQIINNAKMRLATESSKVSEEYINALNSATMMISNYDTSGASQYQKLTFNSLTSYSAYNNQYGLVNANGKLLVSEKDAAIYREIQNTGGDLDDFLAAYGLEYSSTYFSSDTFGGDEIEFEDIGEIYTVEELEEMYFGSEDGSILSYNNALQSQAYVNFSEYYNELITADENYTAAVSSAVNDYIFDTGWEEAYSNLSSSPTSTLSYLQTRFEQLIDEGILNEESDWVQSIRDTLKALTINNDSTLSVNTTVDVVDNGNGTYTIDDDILLTKNDEHGDNQLSIETATFENDDETFRLESDDFEEGDSYCFEGDSIIFDYIITSSETDDDGNVTTDETRYTYDYQGGTTAKLSYDITDADTVQALITSIMLEIKAGITSYVNRDYFSNDTTNSVTQNAKAQYEAAFEQFVSLVFGDVNDDELALIEANKEALYDPGLIIAWAKEKGISTSEDFETIKQIYLLDTLFDVYGEPAAGWIDVNNPDENADAKVQWYTNLYNRMEEGYAVLEDGLASSNEWIQFALESGLVTMEQVDSNNNWVSTIYSNISDITEVTDDTAVTKAEAEYNKAMNSIENKDTRYDLELKNIDTEHSSLETEYDSVKSVIDKNIERSFKIYS